MNSQAHVTTNKNERGEWGRLGWYENEEGMSITGCAPQTVILSFWFHSSKNMLTSAVSWEFGEYKRNKYTDFRRKSGKLVIHIKDDHYINWKNAQI